MNDDEEIVRRVNSGSTGEYRALVERHLDAVFRFVRNLIGDRHHAEDIVQDVFLAAFTNLASFDGRKAKFSTWLFTIARNRAINHLKRNKPALIESIQEQPDFRQNDELEQREQIEQLHRALNSLPTELKTAFVLAEIDDCSYDEIAAIEQIPLGTVKSRIHRAKKRLCAVLKEVEQ